jgi:hypothetical protein
VIAQVYKDLADDVEESKPLEDRKAHTDREVDVVITEDVAGVRIKIGVEATDPKRKADLPVVDKLLGKHADLDTHHVIIVSKSGFTGPALRKIEETHNASGYQPRDLQAKAGLASKIVGQLATIWQKRFSVTIDTAWVFFDLPERLQGKNFFHGVPAGPDFPLLDKELQETASAGAIFVEWATTHPEEMGALVHVEDVAENTSTTLLKDDFGPPWRVNGEEVDELYIMIDTRTDPQAEPTPEPLRVNRLDVRGPAEITVTKIDLTHQLLNDDIAYSVGEAELDGQPTLFVVSYTKKGEKLSSLPLAGGEARRPTSGRKKPPMKRKPRKR